MALGAAGGAAVVAVQLRNGCCCAPAEALPTPDSAQRPEPEPEPEPAPAPEQLRRQLSTTAAADFVRLWRSGACDAAAHAQLDQLLERCPLSGRMIHGLPDDPGLGHLLSTDEWKRLSWVFGPEALPGFLGKSARDICLALGFGERWLTEKLAAGTLFKLAIFPSESADSRLATWDGVEALLQAYYPEVWQSKIVAHWERIRTTPLAELEAEAGYSMLGERNRWLMTPSRLLTGGF